MVERIHHDCCTLQTGLRRADRHCHRQAAADQYRRVEGSEYDVELETRFGPCLRVPDAVQHVGEEQPAEEEHFRDEEQPHPECGGLVLLVQRVEVVLKIRVMGGVRPVIGVRGNCVRQL